MSKYDPSFKAEAVRLALTSSQPISKTARDLGIKDSTLYNWLSQERDKSGNQSSYSEDEINLVDGLNRLGKENMRLREEREILKKATLGSSSHCNNVLKSISGSVLRTLLLTTHWIQ